MSLFSRKKPDEADAPGSSLAAEAEKAYDGTAADVRDKLFYGGIDSARSILLDLASAFPNLPEAERVSLAHQIYIQVWIRSRGGFSPSFSTPTYIREAMLNRFRFLPEDEVIACTDRALDIVYMHEPALREKTALLDAMLSYVQQHAQQNLEIQDSFRSDPEYGLVPDKPIFVAGYGSDKAYLSHLYSESGEKLDFVRNGSMQVEGISGPVDFYTLYLPDKSEYMRVFVCLYGTRNTEDAPAGTIYRED